MIPTNSDLNDGSQILSRTDRASLVPRAGLNRPRDRNLRAGISISFSAQHPCWFAPPALLSMQAEDGPSLLRLQGQGSAGGKMEKPPARTHLSVGADALRIGRSRAGSDSRRCGVTMAASLTSADPLRLPDATMNSCSRTQAPPTVEAGRARARCTGLADGGSCRS